MLYALAVVEVAALAVMAAVAVATHLVGLHQHQDALLALVVALTLTVVLPVMVHL
jgi:hypothetical protein